ncbi:urea transporter [Arthrobacter dokdonensis]|uniref:urea transporter n=1 Tax=Arthrobacter dokdonellae TaxID=2211210 RepID=UPI0014942394
MRNGHQGFCGALARAFRSRHRELIDNVAVGALILLALFAAHWKVGLAAMLGSVLQSLLVLLLHEDAVSLGRGMLGYPGALCLPALLRYSSRTCMACPRGRRSSALGFCWSWPASSPGSSAPDALVTCAPGGKRRRTLISPWGVLHPHYLTLLCTSS